MIITDIIWIKIKGYFIFINILHVLIPEEFLIKAATFFSIVIATVIIITLFILFTKANLQRRQISFQKKFNNLISEVAICESEEELNEIFSQPEYQKILNHYQKNIIDGNFMIQELADTCKKFSGTTMDNIHWLFQKTDLKKELLAHLKDKRWFVKAKAIQQLAYLQQKDQLPNIFRLANHNNDFVRMEAQIATVKLIGFNGLRFLNVIGYSVSEWQQLRLIQELSRHSIENFDGMSFWLKSKNSSVVEFALRLVEIYQRYEFYDAAVQSLSHSSSEIRTQAVITVGKISNEKTAVALINIFATSGPELQLLILKTLQAIGADKESSLLSEQLNKTDNIYKSETDKEIKTSEIEKKKEFVDEKAKQWGVVIPKLNVGGAL